MNNGIFIGGYASPPMPLIGGYVPPQMPLGLQPIRRIIPNVIAASNFENGGIGSLAAVVNGTGLPGNVPSLTNLSATHGVSNTGPTPNAWRSAILNSGNVRTVFISFNFLRGYNLAGFSFWNLNGGQGINAVTIQYSSNNETTWTTLTGSGVPTSFAAAAVTGSVSPQQFSFSPVYATNVRFVNMTNHGSVGTNTFRLGLNEIQFFTFIQ